MSKLRRYIIIVVLPWCSTRDCHDAVMYCQLTHLVQLPTTSLPSHRSCICQREDCMVPSRQTADNVKLCIRSFNFCLVTGSILYYTGLYYIMAPCVPFADVQFGRSRCLRTFVCCVFHKVVLYITTPAVPRQQTVVATSQDFARTP